LTRRQIKDRYKELSEHAEVENDPEKFQKLIGQINKILDAERTHLVSKTKAKIARQIRSAGTLPWLGFDRVQPDRSVLQGK
jgi:hypothetical protein